LLYQKVWSPNRLNGMSGSGSGNVLCMNNVLRGIVSFSTLYLGFHINNLT